MRKGFIKYSLLLVCILGLAACDDDEDTRKLSLTVTSMDIDDPGGEPLKTWSGDYVGRADPDLAAVIALDESTGGEVLFSGEGFYIVAADMDDTGSGNAVSATVWYRQEAEEKKYSLTVSYRGYPGEDEIHSDISVEDVPAGQLINKDFLEARNLLPAIVKHEYNHSSADNLIIEESAVITAWYYRLYQITLIFRNFYTGQVVHEPASFMIKHGDEVSYESLEESGLIPDLEGYQGYYLRIPEWYPEDDMEVRVEYFPE